MRLGSRRVLLFVGAVLLPSAVLLAATVRLGLQERELEAGRREERRALLAATLARELVARLEQVRAQAIGDQPNPGANRGENPALVLIARVRDGHLVFPWDEGPPRSRRPENARYTQLMEAGETAEFGRGQFVEAAALYGQAAAAGADTARRADAWLRQARALMRAGRGETARARYRHVAALPPSIRDDDDMPLALYAAEGLLRAGGEAREDARPALLALIEARRSLGVTALYALRDLTSLDSARHQAVTPWIAIVERSRTLEREVPGLLSASSPDSVAATPTPWFPFGPEPWLVSAQPPTGDRGAVGAVAVVAAPGALLQSVATEGGRLAAVARSVRLTAAQEPDAEEFGPALPGLRAVFTDPSLLGNGSPGIGPRLFLLVLPVVAGLTLFGAWLLWRDVRREVAAAELRSQIVAGVSHELKTPLTSIRMFAETLLDRPLNEEVRREYLETIVHESERLTRLINNVLGFSRIEAGQQRYRFAATDLGEVAREAAHAMAYPLAQAGFQLDLSMPECPPIVRADRDALTRAVLNLVTNALKFSGDHRTIALSVGAENGDALVRVRDWGRGITPGDRERIFDPFFRAPDVEEENISGTGLGLPLVAHVARAHGGRVEVESALGEGSTFTIRLPLERSG